jgi:nucleotide-binding universal stress UspA family protein
MGAQELVVGVDGSPASYTALRCALANAGRTGAQVRAVLCWTPVAARGWEASATAEPVSSRAEQEARAGRELAQVVAAALAGVGVVGELVLRAARDMPGSDYSPAMAIRGMPTAAIARHSLRLSGRRSG